MSSVNRLLIVKLSSIGDAVHALPVAAALKRSFPHIEISWIVEQMAAPMVTGNPNLYEVITLPTEWRVKRFSRNSCRTFLNLRRSLISRRFDIVIDLQGLSKSAIVAAATGARYRYGYDWLRELAPVLEHRVARRPESMHVVDQYLDVARFLGAKVTAPEFTIMVPQTESAAAIQKLANVGINYQEPFVVINPSSGGGGNKGWEARRYAYIADNVVDKWGIPVLLVGSQGDREVANTLMSHSTHAPADLVGGTNLKQLVELLRLCTVHLCGDTGSAHIAAAVGTPVVSLFGRSNPQRLAPYGQEHNAIHHRDACAPACWSLHDKAPINSKQKCLSPPPQCMQAITQTEVFNRIERILSGQDTGTVAPGGQNG